MSIAAPNNNTPQLVIEEEDNNNNNTFASLPTIINNDNNSALVLQNNSNNFSSINNTSNQTIVRHTNRVVTTSQIVTQRHIQRRINPYEDSSSSSSINMDNNDNITNSGSNNALVPINQSASLGNNSQEEITTISNSEDNMSRTTTKKHIKKCTRTKKFKVSKLYKDGVLIGETTIEIDPETKTEIIEENGDFDGKQLALMSNDNNVHNQLALTCASSSGLSTTSTTNNSGAAGINFQAVAGFKTISETGEEQSTQIASGPMQAQFIGNNRNPFLSIRPAGSNNLAIDADGLSASSQNPTSSNDLALATIGNQGTEVQEIMPDGAIVTRKIFGTKTATVTHSSCINGETKTSTKSAFMSFQAETMHDAQSSIEGMEQVFQGMMETIKGGAFGVLDQFVKSKDNSFMDQFALACGSDFQAVDHESSSQSNFDENVKAGRPFGKKFGFLPFIKPLPAATDVNTTKKEPGTNGTTPHTTVPATTTSNEASKLSEMSRLPTEEQQQDMIRKKLESIQSQSGEKRDQLNWYGMEEVQSSGIIEQMKREQIFLQEALFEIITTEACYNITLDMLINNFYKSEIFDPHVQEAPINSIEKNQLFSNILLVKGVSFKFLKDLEGAWSQQKPRLNDIADVILKHAEDEEFRQQYIRYTANVAYQQQVLEELLQKEKFKAALAHIERNSKNCRLSFLSLLSAPGFRLMRIKLLLNVLLKLINDNDILQKELSSDVIDKYNRAADIIDGLIKLCEQTKFKLDQKKRIIDLCKLLESSNICKGTISLASQELIKEGELKAHTTQVAHNILKKFSKKKQPSVYLIVCSGIVIIAKKKSPGGRLLVMDHCPRNRVQAECFCSSPQAGIGTCSEPTCTSTSSLQNSPSSIKNEIAPTQQQQHQHHHHHHTSVTSQLPSNSFTSSSNSNTTSGPFPFKLRFISTQSSLMSDSLILAAPSQEARDQWLNAICSSNSA